MTQEACLSKTDVLRSHFMCGAFGALGASVAATRKFYRVLITETTKHNAGDISYKIAWDFGWCYYYLSRPFLGAILGSLTFTLSFVGFQILARTGDLGISQNGRHLLYGLAFLSGFSVSQVLDRLKNIADQALKQENQNTD